MKNNLTEARFQFLAGVINENEYNIILKESETLDKILDKISTFGIDSLYPDEKKYLDKYSKDIIDNPVPRRYGDDLVPITPSDLTISPFEVSIEEGYIGDEDDDIKAYQVQILYAKKNGDMVDVDNLKKFRYLNDLGAGIWTVDPLEQYEGDEYDSIGGRYNIMEFDTTNEVEEFMKSHLVNRLKTGF